MIKPVNLNLSAIPNTPTHCTISVISCLHRIPKFSLYKPSIQGQRGKFLGQSSMEEGGTQSSVVPESVMDSVTKTLANMEEVKSHVLELLSLAEPEVLALVSPLQRAQSLFLLAEATSTLFTLRLRCTGVHPDDHPVKSELERINLYRDKLHRFLDWSKAPLRPSTTLNYQAATRFIEHSLPDLTNDQRRSMRSISKGEATRIKYSERSVQKKRKYQSTEKQSVQVAAKDFLEKAARELLGDDNGALKGPIKIDSSEDEDTPMDL